MIIRDADLESNIHLDFVPLADVLFNLLIFFLLATTIAQVEREMDIALPAARSAGPITQAMREIIVNIDANGRAVINGMAMNPDALQEFIASAVAANPDQKVTVRGDRSVAYAHIVAVLDACKSGGVNLPFLDTAIAP